MRNRTSVTGDAARLARLAATDLANLQRAMRGAEDSMAGLSRAIRAATIKTPRRVIKGSRTAQPLLFQLIGNAVGNYLVDDIKYSGDDSGSSGDGTGQDGGYFSSPSFYRSSSQISGSFLRGLIRGQRIL